MVAGLFGVWVSNAAILPVSAYLRPIRDGKLSFLALRRTLWRQSKFSAEEEDSGSVVFEVSEASGVGFKSLDL